MFLPRALDCCQFDVACPRNRRKLLSKYYIQIGGLVECQSECTRQGRHESVKDISIDGKKKQTAVATKHTATLGTSQEKTSGKAEPTDEGA